MVRPARIEAGPAAREPRMRRRQVVDRVIQPKPKPIMTVGELKRELQDVPDDVWVFLRTEPLNRLIYEPGASEPFVSLQFEP